MIQISEITNKVPNYKSLQEKKPLLQRNFFVAINFKSIATENFLFPVIKSMAIDYCNKIFFVIEFGCNKIFFLLLKILYYNKKYCCYNLLQQNFCCNRLP